MSFRIARVGWTIDFKWKIFAAALDILNKIQADQQGKHITPENLSDRIIFMTMLKHWRLMCSYFEEDQGYDMVEDFENSGLPSFQVGSVWPWNTQKIIETLSTSMESIAILICCKGLFMPRTSSVSSEQPQSGVEQILKKQVKADSKVLQNFKWSRWISGRWLVFQDYRMHRKPNVPEFEGFEFDAIMRKVEYLRTTAKFYQLNCMLFKSPMILKLYFSWFLSVHDRFCFICIAVERIKRFLLYVPFLLSPIQFLL